MSASTYLVIDTETCGLNPRYHQIVQLSALRCDSFTGDVVEEFDSYVHPYTYNFTPEASAINGLTRSSECLQMAPDKAVVAERFKEFIKDDDHFVGYNLKFDLRMIRACEEFNAVIPTQAKMKVLDLLPLIRKLKLPVPKNKLSIVCEHFGYTANFHNSLDDCKATNFLFRLLLDRRLKSSK